MANKKVLITGAAGYIASQMLPTFRQRYDLVMLDVSTSDRDGNPVEGVQVADLIDDDRSKYAHHFEGVDAVVHLGYRARSGELIDHYYFERQNVAMAYNVLRCAFDAGVERVVIASSNHAADWYEHMLIHSGEKDVVDPYELPLSDNFYGWAKATYEHMGFLFASGAFASDAGDPAAVVRVGGINTGRRMGVVCVRIGAPRDLDLDVYVGNPALYKRDLGAYISPRDITQLFRRSMEIPDIRNEHGVPWLVVYGISNNTRAFWSLVSARKVLGYEPEDDSEVKYASDIAGFLTGNGASWLPGRVQGR